MTLFFVMMFSNKLDSIISFEVNRLESHSVTVLIQGQLCLSCHIINKTGLNYFDSALVLYIYINRPHFPSSSGCVTKSPRQDDAP